RVAQEGAVQEPRLRRRGRLASEAALLRDVLGDQQEAGRHPGGVAAGGEHHARAEAAAVLAPALDGALPLARVEGGPHHLLRLAGLDVLRDVEDRRVRLADDLARLVAVDPPRA